MTIEEMVKRRKELGYTYEQLSVLSGVPVGTINKIFNGYTTAPRFATLQALEKVLTERRHAEILAESGFAYGEEEVLHTREEREQLPDDVRTELIDGKFYDMASPKTVHQRLLGELYSLLRQEVKDHGCGETCEVFLAPYDVVLDNDAYTVVQPDLLINCDPCRIRADGIYGAPDLVVEILSPATKVKDLFIKLNKYRSSGVREYWIVDPDKATITVYLLALMRGDTVSEEAAGADELTVYRIAETESIPLWISGGRCRISMESLRGIW